MTKLSWTAILSLLLLTACGSTSTPSRLNDFTPLTSMQFVAVPASIAAKTSVRLTVIGNFSGLFTRDITSEVTLASTTPTIADFTVTGLPTRIRGIAPGTATVTATRGGLTAATTVTVNSATITTLAITGPAGLAKGLSTRMTVSGTFSDSSVQDLTVDATWTSDTPSIASVSDAPATKGVVQALAVGATNINATFDTASTATGFTVAPAALQTIAVTPANPTILSLSGIRFFASGTFSDGSTADITSSVSWTSSQPVVAAVDATGAAAGLTQGSSQITATKDGIPGSTNLKVSGGNLESYTLSPPSLLLVKGNSARITATGTFRIGTATATRDITGSLLWAATDSTLAAVSAPVGSLVWITAAGGTPAGNLTTVTAKYGTATSASENVTVYAPLTLTNLALAPTVSVDPTQTVGAGRRFTLTATYSDGSVQDVTYAADWSTDNTAAVTMGNIGPAKGRCSGVSATITPLTISAAYTYGTQATVTISLKASVVSRTLSNFSAVMSPSTLTAGSQGKITVTANYADGTALDVTEDAVISSDNTNVATLIDSQSLPGVIAAVDSGSANISVTFGSQTVPLKIVVP